MTSQCIKHFFTREMTSTGWRAVGGIVSVLAFVLSAYGLAGVILPMWLNAIGIVLAVASIVLVFIEHPNVWMRRLWAGVVSLFVIAVAVTIPLVEVATQGANNTTKTNSIEDPSEAGK